MILGFDPGRDKCGVAVMGVDRQIRFQEVIAADQVSQTLVDLCNRFPISALVIGNQTTSKQWQQQLRQTCPQDLKVLTIDERNSTVEARDRYWDLYPPKGLQRLIPQGMRLPPRPIDDIVAVILIERYFNQLVSP
ncbi:pre-16S rRNA-processing nuclease YqgF [Lyngbya confervoides]|uniref:Pre-16S rRNA-processing nuclease YqgF n=1 Tax=Lyngbya confervoides BDU141951 TaxID=1574623 RepID=A0ABD4T613_9CYAN|nr:pre-16S rRNA-processing nuclease YqgF [Lyngbya confervoides]MCM1984152.1 pre-16S rRNA-processing nuclease YqgF [Lyngbya confervoides BDU141951]